MTQNVHHQVLIVGGGTAGITVAAQLSRGWRNRLDVAVIEPSQQHFYQPLWTLVGAGLARKESTVRRERDVMPRRATWIQEAVVAFEPAANRLKTSQSQTVSYDYLVVAAGIQLRWEAIPGLSEALGRNGVCSNYSFQTVDSTWQAIREFRGGNAVFTNPSGAVKCGGAPQKIMYLADDWFRRRGIRQATQMTYASALPVIFAVEPYRSTLERVLREKEIDCRFRQELVAVHGERKIADFRHLDSGEVTALPFDLLHVTPPMGPPDFLAQSPLADAEGWVDVDPETLRHRRYANVFGLGDASNLPTSKTGAAIRKQAPVLVANLRAALAGEPLSARYDGYTSCPLITGFGKLVLAEFDYRKQPTETFPWDQSQERWSMWLFKRYFLPQMYWHGMLKGRV